MNKRTGTSILLVVILLTFSCTTAAGPPAVSDTDRTESPSAAPALPEWMYQPPHEDGAFFGIGSGRILSDAQQRAIINLGEQFSTRVEAVLVSESVTDRDDLVHSISRQFTEHRIYGARFLDQYEDKNGHYWVLVKAPMDCILDIAESVLLSYRLDLRQEPREIIHLVERVEENFIEQKEWIFFYKTGDIGPAGGIIFYDKGYVSDGWRYLEAWIADEPEAVLWQLERSDTPFTDISVGSGYQNTYTAMAADKHPPAALARNAAHGGFNDWFLPSKDELNLLYGQRESVGGFSSTAYWSSSQSSEGMAWAQHLSSGGQGYSRKDFQGRIRLVRAF